MKYLLKTIVHFQYYRLHSNITYDLVQSNKHCARNSMKGREDERDQGRA